MEDRIKDKVLETRKYLEELENIKAHSLEEYKRDIKSRAACERYVEKIMEAVTDLVFLVIKTRKLGKPEDDQSAYELMFDDELISKEIFEKLKDAKGMKNVISHQYGNIDDEIVYEAISHELCDDVESFLKQIIKNLSDK